MRIGMRSMQGNRQGRVHARVPYRVRAWARVYVAHARKGGHMRSMVFGALVGIMVCVCAWAYGATLHTSHKYPATIRCAHVAEDSMAHVRMAHAAYPPTDGVYRYVCRTRGY